MTSQPFARMFDQISKAALIDALWCACQLGTDESEPQIATQAARNVIAALVVRGDRLPKDITSQAKNTIDSDPAPDSPDPYPDLEQTLRDIIHTETRFTTKPGT